MIAKVDVGGIVRDHVKTLRKLGDDSVSWSDVAFFYGIPLLGGAILCANKMWLNDGTVSILLATFAILTGLLFNLLVLVFDLIRKDAQPTSNDPQAKKNYDIRNALLKETFANISYCALAGIVIALLGLIALRDDLSSRAAASFLIYALSGNFVLTLLMVLRRIHTLLSHELQ